VFFGGFIKKITWFIQNSNKNEYLWPL